MRQLLVIWCIFLKICDAFSTTQPSLPVQKQIPITVISGFLGSGKTTLLKSLLENKEGLKIAVVVNDVASVNIDSKLVSGTSSADGMVELQNGCACCSLSEELLASVSQLVTMSDMRSESDAFDHIVVEMSGVADPKGVRSQFQEAIFYNMPIMDRVRLDTMVTVIDCSVFLKYLQSTKTANRTDTPELFYKEGEEVPEVEEWMEDIPPLLLDALLTDRAAAAVNSPFHENNAVAELLVSQTETADVVLLNKVDLVDDDRDLTTINQIVSALNTKADVKKTTYGKVPIERILAAADGNGVAEAGVVDDHRDAIEAAEQAVANEHNSHTHEHSHNDLSELSHTHNHDHSTTELSHSHDHEDSTIGEVADHSHSHNSHDHHDSTTAEVRDRSELSHTHNHDHSTTELSHSHDHGDLTISENADHSHSHNSHDHHDSTTAEVREPSHSHNHNHNDDAKVTDHSHSHSHEGEEDCTHESHTHSHSHGEICDDPDCTDTSHSHSHSHATTTLDQLGIGSFVYKARKPFHPQRLVAFLRHLPISRGLPEKEGDEPSLKVSKDTEKALQRVVRSKGFVWLGDSNIAANYWSHSGTAFEVQCLGRWWSTLSREEWPPEATSTILADFDDTNHEEGSNDSVGDRRQEVVFIGPGLLNPGRQEDIVSCLDQC